MKRFSKVLSLVMATTLALGMFAFSPIKASASDGIEDFVRRCYSLALQREPEEEGLNNWVTSIKNGERVGSAVVYWFIFSEEYLSLDKSDEEFVNDLYTMFLGRPADEEGYNTWCGLMQQGWSRERIFGGFANSVEFDGICSDSGITAGFYTPDYPIEQVNAVNLFVERLYKTCLGRLGDQGGQKTWVEGMLNDTFNGTECATNFIKSPEYENKGLTDEQYVENLYKSFMGRDSDEAGKQAWVEGLKNGTFTRDQVFEGFANSAEFNGICDGYGIESGEYKATDVADPNQKKDNPNDQKQDNPSAGKDTAARTEKHTNSDGSWYVDEYDADGKLTKCTSYNHDGGIDQWIIYEYDGNMTKCTLYIHDGSILSIAEYDADGRMTKRAHCWSDGSIRFIDEYDADGNKTKETWYNFDGSIDFVREYDADGNEKKATYYNSDGSIESWTTYEYDADGNKTKATEYNSDGSIDYWYTYEYDADGNEKKATYYNSDGSIDYWYTDEYDTDGNNTKKTWYNPDGSIESWITYEYDANGRRTKKTWYNPDGSIEYSE